MADITIPDLIRREAAKQQIPPALALAVAEQESDFNPTALGPTLPSGEQAVGAFQLLPSTARRLGRNPQDIPDNVRGGVEYLRQLMDRHQGDLPAVLKEYGGVRQNTTYVPQVLDRLSKYQQLEKANATTPAAATPAATPAPATSGPPPQPEFSFDWRHPLSPGSAVAVGQAVFGSPEKRESAAGALGGIAGGVGGELFGPWGARAGSAAGAAAGGALERGAEELLGTAPPPPPGDDTGVLSRMRDAGERQLAYDAVGQGIGKGIGMVGKRAVQSRIGANALKYFTDTHAATVKGLQDMVDTLNTQSAEMKLRVSRFGDTIREAMGVTRQAADRAGAADVQGIASGVREGVGRAQTLADSATLGARQQAAQKVATARTTGQAAKDAQAAAYQTSIGTPPPEIPIGNAVRDVYTGPVRTAQNAAGERLAQVAREGPAQDLTAVIEQARQMAKDELLPQAERFPRVAADAGDAADAAADATAPTAAPINTGVLDASGQPITRPAPPPPPPPPPSDPFATLGQQATDAELQQTIKDPAMPTIARILNTVDPANVPMGDLHQWVSELQQANASRGLYNVGGGRSKAEGLSVKLAGMLREKLGEHAPYNEAADAYGRIAKLWEALPETARAQPEKIVQMLNPNDPSTAKLLVTALSEVAGEGGGKAQGQAALNNVQHAYLHRNILQGGIQTLGNRLDDLYTHPEFVQTLFGDKTSQATLRGLEEQALTYRRLVNDAKIEIAQQLASGKEAVSTTQASGKQAVRDIRQAGASEIRDARAQNLTAKRQLEGRTADLTADVQRRSEDRLAGMQQQLEQARVALREGKDLTPEHQRFLDSTLSPKNLRKAEQVAADVVNATMHGTTYWGGLSAWRLLKGVSDSDLLLYAAKSGKANQALANHVWASAKPGWVAAQASRFGLLGNPDDDGAPPPPPTTEINATITGAPSSQREAR